MTNKVKRDRSRDQKTYARKLEDGLSLRAQVFPCVFMYSGYPLQIQILLRRDDRESLGEGFLSDSKRTAATYSDSDVRRLLGRVRVLPCSRCSNPAFDPSTIQTNRGGLCEPCFMSDIKTECAAIDALQRQETAARDRVMKRKGMVVRVSAWVHPNRGGDDYEVEWYFDRRPTTGEVASLLRNEGSSCLHDYAIIAL